MEGSVDAFRERFRSPWLLEGRSAQVEEIFEAHLRQFEYGQRVLLMDADPIVLWGKFLAAVACRSTIFLGLNAWSPEMLEQARARMHEPVEADLAGYILIPTGGSGGQLKWAYHTWKSLSAAVWGLARGMSVDRLCAMAALPLGHVSGLMPGLRAWITGGLYQPLNNKAIEAGQVPVVDRANRWQLSLVPTQLGRWIEQEALVHWLRSFECIWVGGARLPEALAQKARELHIPLAPCYGMTETAAMVLVQKPEDFLKGDVGWQKPLPHGHLILEGQPQGWCRVGFSCGSLFEGYFPAVPNRQEIFWTQDEIHLDAGYGLSQLRRIDRIMITGGEKVDPQVVEDTLLGCEGVRDVAIGVEDHPEWGQQMVAYWVPEPGADVDEKSLRAFLKARLSAFQCPKKWVCVAQVPGGVGRKMVYRHI